MRTGSAGHARLHPSFRRRRYRGMTVKQVLEAVARAARRPVPHVMGSRRAGDPARLVASNAAAHREFVWNPTRSDVQTIVDTAFRWHQTHPKGYSSAE